MWKNSRDILEACRFSLECLVHVVNSEYSWHTVEDYPGRTNDKWACSSRHLERTNDDNDVERPLELLCKLITTRMQYMHTKDSHIYPQIYTHRLKDYSLEASWNYEIVSQGPVQQYPLIVKLTNVLQVLYTFVETNASCFIQTVNIMNLHKTKTKTKSFNKISFLRRYPTIQFNR